MQMWLRPEESITGQGKRERGQVYEPIVIAIVDEGLLDLTAVKTPNP